MRPPSKPIEGNQGAGNRADVVKVLGVDGFGQLHRVAGTVDVGSDLAGLVRAQFIDRRQMIKMANLAFEHFDAVSRHPEFFAGEGAKHRHHPRRHRAPVMPQGRHLAFTLLADQKVNHRVFAFKQFFDEPFTNEAGGPGDKILGRNLRLDGVEN